MWGLLKHLGSDCWGNHEWISRANPRGLWLECRRCGHESPGLELPTRRYRRTQEGAEEAHRIGGMAPALWAARSGAPAASDLRRFGDGRPALRPSAVAAVPSSWDATAASSAVASTDAERRWLQAWRALSPEERVMAERVVAGLSLSQAAAGRGVRGREDGQDYDRQDRMIG